MLSEALGLRFSFQSSDVTVASHNRSSAHKLQHQFGHAASTPGVWRQNECWTLGVSDVVVMPLRPDSSGRALA